MRIFSEDIAMDFGIDKCAKLMLRRGKVTASDGIELPDGREIKSLDEGSSYKYLRILEADRVMYEEMKTSLTKEYFRLRKLLKSKLNGGHVIKGINTWAVSIPKYSAAFIDWTKEELKELDRKTRKYLTIYNSLHPRDSVARLYLPRKLGGRG